MSVVAKAESHSLMERYRSAAMGYFGPSISTSATSRSALSRFCGRAKHQWKPIRA